MILAPDADLRSIPSSGITTALAGRSSRALNIEGTTNSPEAEAEAEAARKMQHEDETDEDESESEITLIQRSVHVRP